MLEMGKSAVQMLRRSETQEYHDGVAEQRAIMKHCHVDIASTI